MSDVHAALEVNQTVASSEIVIPDEWYSPRLTVTGAETHVASVYLSRWSAPITCNGVTIRPGTGHEFGWDDTRWVSLGAVRRGVPRPGQWGERARKRRAKRRERARFTRAYKRFYRFLDTRQGQGATVIQSGTGGIRFT